MNLSFSLPTKYWRDALGRVEKRSSRSEIFLCQADADVLLELTRSGRAFLKVLVMEKRIQIMGAWRRLD